MKATRRVWIEKGCKLEDLSCCRKKKAENEKLKIESTLAVFNTARGTISEFRSPILHKDKGKLTHEISPSRSEDVSLVGPEFGHVQLRAKERPTSSKPDSDVRNNIDSESHSNSNVPESDASVEDLVSIGDYSGEWEVGIGRSPEKIIVDRMEASSILSQSRK
ncbi:hypothetical protein QYF36_023657 [Acer negundo]|nr:hypothetical protein QYF36_023657 [Acer negundo]